MTSSHQSAGTDSIIANALEDACEVTTSTRPASPLMADLYEWTQLTFSEGLPHGTMARYPSR